MIQHHPRISGVVKAFAYPSAQEMVSSTSADDPDGCRLWYEVSLVSLVAEARFEQNLSLELGEDANWVPGHVLRAENVEQLLKVKDQLVQGMDDVGAGNFGPAAREEARRLEVERKAEEKRKREAEKAKEREEKGEGEEFW